MVGRPPTNDRGRGHRGRGDRWFITSNRDGNRWWTVNRPKLDGAVLVGRAAPLKLTVAAA
jgi:hypothetical protein